MARRIDDLLLAWKALSVAGARPGWQGISLDAAGPCALQAARRVPENQEALLLGFRVTTLPNSDQLPSGRGFEVRIADTDSDGRNWLALTKRPEGNLELFSEMVSDVIDAMDAVSSLDERSVQRTALERVRSWQDFMSRGSQGLSTEAELGLAGELVALSELFAAGVPASVALQSWVGPHDEAQDFHLGAGAIEVKSTISSGGFPARISSLEQLDDSFRSPLYLMGFRFRVSDSGKTLPDLVKKVTTELGIEAAQFESLLNAKLLSAGYLAVHADRYSRKFERLHMTIHLVGSNFPKLIPGNVPAEVRAANYVLELSGLPASSITLKEVLENAGVITNET